MKKVFKFLLCFLLVAVLVFPTACNDNSNTAVKAKDELFVAVDNSKIERFDSVRLTLKDGVKEVKWNSSDESVAVVEKGELVGLKAGTTVLSAESGNVKQQQTITVVDEGRKPTIDVDYIPVILGDDYEIDAKAYFNGIELSQTSFTYSVADSSVATMNSNVLTGKEYGDTYVTIKLSWRGNEVATKTVLCTVTKNVAVYTDKTEYVVYSRKEVTILGKSYNFATETKIGTEVFSYGDKVNEDLEFNWTIGNEEIATIDNAGLVKAKKSGKTYATGKCTYNGEEIFTRKIPVIVENPRVSYSQANLDFPFKVGSKRMSFSGAGFNVRMVRDLATGYEYDCDDAGGADLSSFAVGEYAFDIYEKEGAYSAEVNVVIADFVVETDTQLKEATRTNFSYIALAKDVTVKDYKPTLQLANGADGTFNGLGHTLNITYMQYSLYYHLHDFTFKNLAIKCTTNSSQSGALCRQLVTSGNLVIDNCYLESTLKNTTSYRVGGIGDYFWGSTSLTVSNSIIKVNGLEKLNSKGDPYVRDNCGVIFSTWIGTRYKFNNAYAIGQGTLAAVNGPTFYSKAIPSVINQEKGILYQTDAEFKKAYDAGIISYEGYNHYWDLTGDIPVFKAK